MVSTLSKNDTWTIISRAINSDIGDWPEDVARGMMSLTLSSSDRDRMHQLAELNQAGSLSPQQEVEIESYRQAAGLIDLLKTKARVSLLKCGHRV